MASIMQKTLNFFSLYRYICGRSEVPELYNFWCCVSLLSAAMEDKYTCELYKDIPLKPNLYIGLIGPGSCGKGLAISQALQLLESAVDINIYRGRVTFAHLIDRMGTNSRRSGDQFISNPKLYLVMDELKNGVSSNKSLVDEFIGFMTEAYTATNYVLQEGNRSNGEVAIENPCLNWLFGSTPVWLQKTLSKDIYESGFVARTCFICANEDLKVRIPRISYPKDREIVYKHLQDRLWSLNHMGGSLLLSEEAENIFDSWYYNRKVPEDEAMGTIWKRQKELVIRFAMINCIADFESFTIQPNHMQRATYMAGQLLKFAEWILEAANENWMTKPTAEVERKLRVVKSMGHSDLLRYMRAKRGFDKEKLRVAIGTLKDEKKIEILKSKKGGIIYHYLL